MTQRIRVPFPLSSLINSCLTCDVGCCGLDAYNPDIDTFQEWKQQADGHDLQVCLEQLDQLIVANSGEDIEVNFGDMLVRFDNDNNNQIVIEPFPTFTNQEWRGFLQDWKQEINKAVAL